jgi:hypothetical protein
MSEACCRHGELRNVYTILIGKREGKRSLGRPRHGWDNTIKMDLKRVEWKGIDLIHLA